VLTWVEIDAAALSHNVREFHRRLEGRSRLGAVVKSNAYGHGIREVARLAVAAGADWLCVNGVDEGIVLRAEGHRRPVLVLGYVPLERLDDVVEHDLRPVVYNPGTLDRLDELATAAGRRVAVHLKVESGTNRQGIDEADVPAMAARILTSRALDLDGVSTHFANIEDTTDHGYAERQFETFERIVGGLRDAGHEIPVRHAACSAATLLFTRMHLDMARIGISLYGIWPSKETYVSCLERGKPRLDLRPVLTWKTRVAQVKSVDEGSYVGYGCTYRTTRPSRIAVLPVGYHEGYVRAMSGVAHVLIRGRRAPVRGRVCMNMCMVDVTDVPGAGIEDEVVLLGCQGDETVGAEQIAVWSGTIPYEALTRIHPSLPRVVVEAG